MIDTAVTPNESAGQLPDKKVESNGPWDRLKFIMRARGLWAVFFALLPMAGCATSQRVRVSTYAAPDAALARGAQVFVKTEPNVSNPVFDQQVKVKIQKLLVENGYRVGPESGARYILTFQFGTSDYLVHDFYYGYAPYATWGFYGPYAFGYSYYQPYVWTVWDYWLNMRLRDQQAQQESNAVVWIGDAGLSRTRGDKRKAVNYLLVALFDYFGLDTGQAIDVRVKRSDLQLHGLVPGGPQ